MKAINYIFLFLAVGQFALNVRAADKVDVNVITDRDIYVSGEILLAKVFLGSNDESKVVYLDLVGVNGNHINGAKLSLDKGEAAGFLPLPDSLSSGSFFLKVFTNQHQKNSFLLKEILIINRFEIPTDEFVPDQLFLETERQSRLELTIDHLKSVYSKREQVSLKVEMPMSQLEQLEGNLVISVVQCPDQFATGSKLISREDPTEDTQLEDKGIILKGKILDKTTGTSVWGATVFLSIPDSIPYFDYYKTAEDGSFYFLLKDVYGSSKLIIQASKNGDMENLQIEIDDKFKSIPLDWMSQKKVLSPDVTDFVDKSIKLVTYKKVFNTKEYTLLKNLRNPIYPYPFYGKPVYRVDPDLFFELNDFNELCREIMPAAKFRVRDDGYSLFLIDQQMDGYFRTEPFILLDGVPINQIALIAKLGSKEIDWIDIIPRERYFGDLKFYGVLAIYTKENDASRIIPSDHLLKLNYQGLQNQMLLSEKISNERNIPDFRQVLLWNPCVNPNEDLNFNFRTSDVEGTFKVRIFGLTRNGELLESVQTFKVN